MSGRPSGPGRRTGDATAGRRRPRDRGGRLSSIFRSPWAGTPRADVGVYEPPVDPDPLSTEELAEEGMLVAMSALRLSVKNRIILATLRDHEEWMPMVQEAAAAEDLLELAREKDAQLEELGGDPDSREQRRAEVARELRRMLRRAAGDEDLLHRTVVEARDAAWQEIGDSLAQRLRERPEAVDDAAYRRGREARLRELVTIDLEGLERAHDPEY